MVIFWSLFFGVKKQYCSNFSAHFFGGVVFFFCASKLCSAQFLKRVIAESPCGQSLWTFLFDQLWFLFIWPCFGFENAQNANTFLLTESFDWWKEVAVNTYPYWSCLCYSTKDYPELLLEVQKILPTVKFSQKKLWSRFGKIQWWEF